MKAALISIAFCMIHVFSNGQDLRWAFGLMGYSSTVGKKITQDIYGEIITTGNYAASTIDCDPSSDVHTLTMNSSNGNDIYLGKYDINGNLIWAIDMGGPYTDDSQGLATDNEGNIYVSGSFIGEILFTPVYDSTAYFYGSPYNDPKGFIVKYDKEGNYKWAVTLTGTASQAICYGVTTDEFKNIYVTGQMRGNIDFDPGPDTVQLNTVGLTDIFIAKYDSTGALGWAYNIGSNSGYYLEGGRDILYKGGFLYLGGGFTGTDTEFNPHPGLSHKLDSEGATDPFLAKYDVLGNCIWAVDIQSTIYPEYVNGLDVDNNRNTYITGEYWNHADFDPSADSALVTSYGGQDAFVAKYDAFGNYKWAFTAGSASSNAEAGYDIDVTDSGSLYITGGHYGYNSSYSDFNHSSDYNSNTGGQHPYSKIFVARYDTAADFKWAMSVGFGAYSFYDYEAGHGIYARDDGKMFITGLSRSTADFDPSVDNFNLPASGYLYASVASYDANAYSAIGIYEVVSDFSRCGFDIFPNPSSGAFTVRSKKENYISSIEIINMTGLVMKSIKVKSAMEVAIDNLNISPGLYFIKIECENGTSEIYKFKVL